MINKAKSKAKVTPKQKSKAAAKSKIDKVKKGGKAEAKAKVVARPKGKKPEPPRMEEDSEEETIESDPEACHEKTRCCQPSQKTKCRGAQEKIAAHRCPPAERSSQEVSPTQVPSMGGPMSEVPSAEAGTEGVAARSDASQAPLKRLRTDGEFTQWLVP